MVSSDGAGSGRGTPGPGVVDERIAERRAEVRRDNRSRRLRRTVHVLVLLVLLGLGAVVERSSLVALAEIQVTGTQRLPADVVLRAAGLELGTSTVRLRLGQARERVEALAMVDHADVRRVGPITVRIEVVERVPALVGVLDDEAVVVDVEGVVVSRGRDPALTVVQLFDGRLPPAGTVLDATSALGAAHLVWSGLSGPLRAEVDRIEARSAEDVDLLLSIGTRVRMGRADLLDEKVRSLGALLEELAGEPVKLIDVRTPRNPVVSGRDRQ